MKQLIKLLTITTLLVAMFGCLPDVSKIPRNQPLTKSQAATLWKAYDVQAEMIKTAIPAWIKPALIALLIIGVGVGIFLIVKGARVIGECVIGGSVLVSGVGLAVLWLYVHMFVIWITIGVAALIALFRYHKTILAWWNTETAQPKGALVLMPQAQPTVTVTQLPPQK